METKAIQQLLPELRRERGWSREHLSHAAHVYDNEGASVAQIAAIERGVRRPSPRTMLALAEALGVEPTVFAEFRLALIRHIFDEKKVGLDEAIRNAERFGIEPVELSAEDIRKHSHRGLKSELEDGQDEDQTGPQDRQKARKRN